MTTQAASPYLAAAERTRLEDMAYEIRRLTIEMVAWAQWGHIAGSTSMAEVLATLYFHTAHLDPADPDRPDRDRIVLSKAHTSPGLYSALALRGFFAEAELYQYCDIDGMLEGHADMRRTPGLEASGGLLGMGLSVAQGMALADRIASRAGRVFCILGDGELHEGNVWEAAMSAAHHRLERLVAIVDANAIMSKGRLDDYLSVEPLPDKWRTFGWTVEEIDGHDLDAVAGALDRAREGGSGRPTAIVARTIKGKGLAGYEDSHRWHTHAPDPATADSMLRALARMYGRPERGYSRMDLPIKRETFRV